MGARMTRSMRIFADKKEKSAEILPNPCHPRFYFLHQAKILIFSNNKLKGRSIYEARLVT